MDNKPSDKESSEEPTSMVGAGVAIGISIGVALGAVFKDVAIGIALGVALGAAFGAALDQQRKKREIADYLHSTLDIGVIVPMKAFLKPPKARFRRGVVTSALPFSTPEVRQ